MEGVEERRKLWILYKEELQSANIRLVVKVCGREYMFAASEIETTAYDRAGNQCAEILLKVVDDFMDYVVWKTHS